MHTVVHAGVVASLLLMSSFVAVSRSGPPVIGAQKQDEILWTKFVGTDVVGPDDTKLGDVTDILLSKDGKVLAYVVSIGGFLGIGAKDIALAPQMFTLIAGDKSKSEQDKLKLLFYKEQLRYAPQFTPYRAPQKK